MTFGPVTAEHLFMAVCEEARITPAEMIGGGKRKYLWIPRAIFSFLAYKRLGMSTSKVGAVMRRDHSTIINSIQRYERVYQKSKFVTEMLDRVWRNAEAISNGEKAASVEISTLPSVAAELTRAALFAGEDEMEVPLRKSHYARRIRSETLEFATTLFERGLSNSAVARSCGISEASARVLRFQMQAHGSLGALAELRRRREERTEEAKKNAALAREAKKACGRPEHVSGEWYSETWYQTNDQAFRDAMRKERDERPTDVKLKQPVRFKPGTAEIDRSKRVRPMPQRIYTPTWGI